jgi:4'-phosphopantetheinyl transferase
MEGNLAMGQLEEAPKRGFVISWCLPPKDLLLESDEVHVWCSSLDLEAPQVESLERSLAGDERVRAGRFYFQKDRKYFIVARALLRLILGHYLNIEPGQLRFYYSQYGKPVLAGDYGADSLNFNLSHSNGLALYAVTRGREIGVDIERVQADLAHEDIAEKFFLPREVSMLRALPITMQKEAFFKCWTCKEACIKARGEGILLALGQLDISVAPGKPVALLSVNGDPQEASLWSLQDLAPSPGFVAALAVKGRNWRIKCYQWPKRYRSRKGCT